jgi:chromosome segregation ATPase
MTINVDLSQIPELKELPKIERNEERGGFLYPTEYIGNIYRHNNKLIFFGEKVMEEASIGMINLLVTLIKEATEDNDESTQRINAIEASLEQLDGSISSSLEDQTLEINKLHKKISSISGYKEYDDSGINNQIADLNANLTYIQKDITKIQSELETSSLEIMKRIEEIRNRTDLNDIISDKIDAKLTDVYQSFKSVTGDLVREQVQILENDIRLKSNKLTISQIAMFREMGLTIENIIDLKKNNML